MRDYIDLAIDVCESNGASYSDIRIVTIKDERIIIKNGNIDTMRLLTEEGFGIRCIANGGWGFAGSYDIMNSEIRRVAELATRIAKASGSTRKKPVNLADEKAVEGTYVTKFKRDPFEVPLEEKVETLVEADKRLRGYNPELIKRTEAEYRGHQEDKVFANSEGSYFKQKITWCGGGLLCTAVTGGVPPQLRTYPASFGGDYSATGYEYFEALKLLDNTKRISDEAIELTNAKPCPTEKTTLIIDGQQLVLQIHESCGHATELDRVLGSEAAYAGTSFLTPDKIENLQYGSEYVTLTADATLEGGLGTFGFDDEGVQARKVDLVKNGLFVGYQSSRETAALIDLKFSSGGMRADSPQKLPLIRMTNINLEPNGWKRDEIIEDTKNGILMSANKSWSIDDKRVNFQFGTEIGWRIKNGEIKEVLRNPTYTGITPKFWRSMDASSSDDWHLWGLSGCGKGQPAQNMFVGHGCGTARFHDVRIGITKGGG